MAITMRLYKSMIKISFVIFLFLLSQNVRAGMVIDWDVKGKNYNWTMKSATVDEFGKDDIDCGNLLTGNRCTVEFTFGGPSKVGGMLLSSDVVNVKGKRTMKYLVDTWARASLPKSGTKFNLGATVEANPKGTFDLYVIGGSGIGSDYSLTRVGGTGDGFITPPPPVIPDPPPVSCSIDGNIDLPHGILNADEVSGNVKTVAKRVTCSRQATVKVTARANSGGDIVNLRSDGSLRSQLKVNNANGSAGSTFTVPGTSGTSINISSTLMTSGTVAPGTFSGSGVAILSIQ